jgi:hypothetical protein
MGRKQALFVVLSFLCVSIFIPVAASSAVTTNSAVAPAATVRDIIAQSLSQGKTICDVVEETIKAGNNVLEVVENAILMGYPACIVVKCAVEAGGKLEDVVTAAFRVGASSDVIVTCCMEGGADSVILARIIERLCLPGLGYTPPPADQVYVPTFVSTLGGGGGTVTSPFRP